MSLERILSARPADTKQLRDRLDTSLHFSRCFSADDELALRCQQRHKTEEVNHSLLLSLKTQSA